MFIISLCKECLERIQSHLALLLELLGHERLHHGRRLPVHLMKPIT